MDVLREFVSGCWCCKKRPRYGYSIIRGRENYGEQSQISLQSYLSSCRPLPEEDLEIIYDNQEEIIKLLKDLQTSRILLELPPLGRRLTNQLADFEFTDDEHHQVYVGNERDDILKQNLLYLASCIEKVENLADELFKRKVLRQIDLNGLDTPLLKAIAILKHFLNQRDALGFLIGALKVTGSAFVADIFVGNYYPDIGSELMCKISLTREFSPEFILKGTVQKYKTLRIINQDRQEILTTINCCFIEFKGKTLLKSLEHCKNLSSLKLTDVKLTKDFPWTISLPSLKRFVLHINKTFPTKKDFFDSLTPQKVMKLLFFIKDERSNVHSSFFFGTLSSHSICDNHSWNIKDIWSLNVDIFLKIGGRTVLLIDHVKSRLFSRVENFYKIPENVIQPNECRNLYLGWINVVAKSSVPLHLTKLSLYSIRSIDSTKNEINVILQNSSHLREFRFWNTIAAQPWTIVKYSCLPTRLKMLAASFIEIQMDDYYENSSSCKLDHICLFFYKIQTSMQRSRAQSPTLDTVPKYNMQGELLKQTFIDEQITKFLKAVQKCKTVSFISFPPHEQFGQDELFLLMQSDRIRQILLSGCQRPLNFDHLGLYFRRHVLQSINFSNSFILNKNDGVMEWTGRPIDRQEVIQHFYTRMGFELLYSFEVFIQHEIVANLWKFFK